MTEHEKTSTKAMEMRVKALELTLQMFSIFSPDEAKKTLDEISSGGSIQQKLIQAAQVFEIHIMGE
jgi:hypothetical protein